MARFLDSKEAQPIWGVISKLGAANIFVKGQSGDIGSLVSTSNPAPAIKFSFKAFTKSASLIKPPRAVLINCN